MHVLQTVRFQHYYLSVEAPSYLLCFHKT
jgi:hypothetical protein